MGTFGFQATPGEVAVLSRKGMNFTTFSDDFAGIFGSPANIVIEFKVKKDFDEAVRILNKA